MDVAEFAGKMILSSSPVIGDINDAICAVTGYDIIWGESVGAGGRALCALGALSPWMSGGILRQTDEVAAAGFVKGYPTHSAFTRAMGKAGPDVHWHHIVGQNPSNLAQFGPEALHNPYNVIHIDAKIHYRINGYYNSIRDFSGGMRVRDWLKGQSYEAQREFGLDTLRKFGAID